MKKSYIVTLSMVVILAYVAVYYFSFSDQRDSSEEAPPYQSAKLANGLEVITIPNHKVPLVTIVLTVKAGAMTEDPETNGLTHLWEHMFFKGNAAIPNQEAYNRRIRQLGMVYNGDTSAEKVRYYFTMPSVYLEEGLQFMYDAIATPKLDQGELEKERRVVMDEYDRNAAQPGFDRSRLNKKLIYGDLAYLRDPLGERPIIEQATREQLNLIKDQVFVPANSAILIGGDLKHDDGVDMVEKIFGTWQNPKDWQRPVAPDFPQFPPSISYVMTSPNVQAAQVHKVYLGPNVIDHAKDTYIADVFISVVAHASSPFYKKFVDSGLCQGAGIHYPTQADAGELLVYASTRAEDALKVQQMLREEVNLMADPEYFQESLLEDVRRSLQIERQRETNRPSEFVKNLAFWWAITGLDYYSDYLHQLSQVTRTDIASFVRRYLADQNHISSILMSPEDAERLGIEDSSKDLMKQHFGI